MTLLKPMHLWTNACATNGDQSVDINMLNQLSAAGLIVGSQIEVADVGSQIEVDALLQNTINEQIIRKFADNLEWTNAKQPINVLESIFEKIKMLICTAQQEQDNVHLLNISPDALANGNCMDIENECPNNENANSRLIDIISRTVIDCMHQQRKKDMLCGHIGELIENNPFLYGTISQVLVKNLKQYLKNVDGNSIECIEVIEKILNAPETIQQIESNVKTLAITTMQTNKIDLIKAMVNESNKMQTATKCERKTEISMNILNNIQTVMQNETIDELLESIHNLISHEPTLTQQIVVEMQNHTENLINENSIAEILRKCIVSVVQKSTIDDIKQITEESDETSVEKLREYLSDTVSLARALGLTNCILNVSNILNSHEDVIGQLEKDANSFELLQRIVVMHKLAQSDVKRQKALDSLRHDPYSARSDLVLRELLRCSGICTINVEENNKLKDSNDVPISLIYSRNELAIEDFFMRRQTKPSGPILIVKDRFQAVVPRELSRDVLTGKCAYTVLDENGVRHFEPLHMFTALKLKNVPMFEHRFSSYTADKTDDDKQKSDCDIDFDSILNMGAMTTASNNGFIAYKSTYWPRKEYDHCFSKHRRHPLFFDKSQVNYRRSFYL